MNLGIHVETIRGSALVRDYLHGAGRAAPFYEGRPFELASYRRKLEETRARFQRPEREAAARALRPTSAAAAARLTRFVEEGGAVVTTGQQAGLFTGPLYTVHKILSAIRLSAALEAELGCVILPVFWVASEDHDWAEVNHVLAVDGEGEPRRFELRGTTRRPVPMSEMLLGADVESTVDDFLYLIESQGDTTADLSWIREHYRPGVSVADAFRGTVERLFEAFDLLVTDAADPALKAASVPMLERALTHADEQERLVVERDQELVAAGYTPQVEQVAGATQLFFHGPAGRERLERAESGFAAREGRLDFTGAEVVATLREDPGRFSPNALLRPVVESAVFPTLAYVAGPAEAAYFAQIGPLFRAAGIMPPVVFPRFSALLIPHEAQKALDAAGLTLAELREPRHEVQHGLAVRRLPGAVTEALNHLRTSVVGEYARLMEASREVDANLDPALGASRNRALLEVERARRKVVAHQKRRDASLLAAVTAAQAHLHPEGAPQERALNVFPYLAQHGHDLLHEIASRMTVEWEPEAPRRG